MIKCELSKRDTQRSYLYNNDQGRTHMPKNIQYENN